MATDALYSQIHKRMVESGEWNRIYATLADKLNELGWIDELRHQGKEQARNMHPLQFSTLFADLDAHAQASVPLAVKQEIIGLIKSFVEKQLDA
ncbi:hypothetical protein BD410DRAFT_790913 [Rickenella mellea]|uniref:Transcription and mRNA export factor SUS1 n=1 Tax=Rickenella mellea TaxID=50990 RepID=A0A4Y7Q0P6_9AGAM|nr:hypothetical protein BD410DRAFT_790913 [Rickenella mellea]